MVISAILGFLLAVPVALARLSTNPLISGTATAYSLFFRGTPLLVQIFLIYFGLGQFDIVRSSFLWPFLREAYVCALITFVLNTAAYSAEIVRGGILAVPHGEVEAARACGMSTFTAYRLVILPRAFSIVLPAYSNEVIILLKGTALASTITLLELMGEAQLDLVEHLQADPGLRDRRDHLLPADARHHPDLRLARAALQPLPAACAIVPNRAQAFQVVKVRTENSGKNNMIAACAHAHRGALRPGRRAGR